MTAELTHGNGIFVEAEGPHLSNQGLLLLTEDYPIRQIVFYDKSYNFMGFCEMDPEALGSLWLKSSASWGGGRNHFR
jgi:hypothetical protein